jgi:hypothetical protein
MMKNLTKILLTVSILSIGANANEWRDAKISASGEKMWKNIGYTNFNEAKKWGMSEYNYNKAKRWSLNGIKSYDEASRWIKLGVNSPAIASQFKKNGFNTSKIKKVCGDKLVPVGNFLNSNIHTYEDKCIMGGFIISSVIEEHSFFGGDKIEAFAYNLTEFYGEEVMGKRAVWITADDKKLTQDFIEKKAIYGLYKITNDTKEVDLANGSNLTINILDRIIAVR